MIEGRIVGVVHVFGFLIPRFGAATGTAAATAAALDATAEAIDDAGQDGDDNDGADDDGGDDGPFAVGFGHAVVPAG